MLKRVLMYCDATHQIGFGHLMRTLTLAEEGLRQGWNIEIAGHFSEKALNSIRDRIPTVTIHAAPEGVPFNTWVDEVLAASEAVLVHADSYSPELTSALSNHHSLLLSNMQDASFGARSATFVVDANLDAELRFSPLTDNQYYLLGVDATLIRGQVKSARATAPEVVPDRSILLVLGGSDPTEATPKVVQALQHIEAPIQLTVIAPAPLHDQIRDLAQLVPGTTQVIEFAHDLPALATQHRALISATGTSTWDFAYLGIPSLATFVTSNQEPGYHSVINHGIALGIGNAHSLDNQQVSTNLELILTDVELRSRLCEQGSKLIDGLGAWRVVSTWSQLLELPVKEKPVSHSPVTMRPVTRDDAQLLFDWRNDEGTRSVSQNADPLNWDNHVTWLTKSLSNPARRLSIAEQDGFPVGTVRWDRHQDHQWEVSITVAPEYRGRSLGPGMLDAAERAIAGQLPIGAVATIHVNNVASRKLFSRAGYLPYRPANEQGFAQFKKWLFA